MKDIKSWTNQETITGHMDLLHPALCQDLKGQRKQSPQLLGTPACSRRPPDGRLTILMEAEDISAALLLRRFFSCLLRASLSFCSMRIS